MATLRLSVLFSDAWRETLREFARPLAHAFGRRCRPASLHLDLDALPDERLRDLGLLDGRGPSLRRPEYEPAAFNAPARSRSPNGPSTGAGWRFRR